MRKYMQETVASPYKIMAIDDDFGILDSLKVVLRRSGYDLTTYSNPVEAIEVLKKEKYDLLVSTINQERIAHNKAINECQVHIAEGQKYRRT